MDTIATPRRTRMFALAWLVAASALLGAFTMKTFDLDRYRSPVSIAREYAADGRMPTSDRVNAMAVVWQDMLANLDLLDAIANTDSAEAQHARNVLDGVRARLAKTGR